MEPVPYRISPCPTLHYSVTPGPIHTYHTTPYLLAIVVMPDSKPLPPAFPHDEKRTLPISTTLRYMHVGLAYHRAPPSRALKTDS